MSDDVIRAAGGVIFRRRSGILETLIVHRPRYDDLTLPKGKAHDGESIEATALREIREETGVTGELGPELQSVSYTDPLGRPKVVRYWLVKADGAEAFQPDGEVDAVSWVAVEAAPATLTNQRDREVLAEAARLTEPLFLVRHAKAGARAEWRGDDRDRPLSVKGERQANRLVAAFRGKAVDRILSSPTLRADGRAAGSGSWSRHQGGAVALRGDRRAHAPRDDPLASRPGRAVHPRRRDPGGRAPARRGRRAGRGADGVEEGVDLGAGSRPGLPVPAAVRTAAA